MKPYMKKREIRLFKHLLTQKTNGILDILEWGSGGSTVYFTDFLESQSIPYTWTSIEYNKMWYEKIKEATQHKQAVSLVLFDVGNNSLKQRSIPMDEYVNYPNTLNKKFDIIFVDGRKRRRCILEAKHLLKEGGTVLVHDAQRKYYQCAFKEYTDQHFIGTSLWRGTNKSISQTQKYINVIIHQSFKIMYIFFVKPSQMILGILRNLYHRYAK